MKARHLLTIKSLQRYKGCAQWLFTAHSNSKWNGISGINSPDLPQRENQGVRCWGSDLRTIQAMAYAQQTPSCLLEHCPAFQSSTRVDSRFCVSCRTMLLGTASRIKMLSSCYQQGKKSANPTQGNPHCYLSSMCCRVCIHCTFTFLHWALQAVSQGFLCFCYNLQNKHTRQDI